eukprot:TRINITY_DN14712_c0_g3_i4.p1 TRINITY_DN14712_c0_g3~~TRINITY_DN14712_c0_g3_i4.p1  ORF type:complete len:594 (-),score=123.58 TRINITY_DN14712_c0_g3_i4:454-2235(-)
MGVIYSAIDNGSEETVNLWHPVFCAGIASMTWKYFEEKFLPRLKKMAGLGSTHVTRNAAANMLAAAAVLAAEKKELERTLLHSFMQLCQDSNVIIRKTALNNLRRIIPKVEPSEVERLFFAELVEHLKDPNPWIRFIVIELLIKFHALFSTDSLNKEFLPLVSKEFARGWKDPDNWLLLNCGSVVNVLLCRGFFTEDCLPDISKFYESILFSKDPKLNAIAVRNIAPMIDMQLSCSPSNVKYSTMLHEFAVGPLYQEQVLKILPELIRVHFKHKKMSLMRPIIAALMQNESQIFAVELFSCLSKQMPKVLAKDKEDKVSYDEKFQKQVLNWIKQLWKAGCKRHLRPLIEIVPRCQEFFPLADYNHYFMEELVGMLRTGNKAEKKLGASSFCLLYLKNYMPEVRNDALNRVLAMAQSKSCFERQAVLSFVEAAIDHFSLKFLIDKKIIDTHMSLAEDKVSNVRIQFSRVAKKIVTVIARNAKVKSNLSNLLNLLQNDMDKDVRKLAVEASQKLKAARIRSEAEEKAKEKQEEDLEKREKQVTAAATVGRGSKEKERRRGEEAGVSVHVGGRAAEEVQDPHLPQEQLKGSDEELC